jgi:adenine specific DNA methylase Mod
VDSYNLCAELKIPSLIFWGGNYYADQLPPSRCWIAWDKEVTGSFADIELAWTNIDQVARLLRHQWSGLMKGSERGEGRVHPTQKPSYLLKWVFKEMLPETKTVLDQFIGSGSTIMACEQANRKCFGLEMSPAYVAVAIQRWADATGKTPRQL